MVAHLNFPIPYEKRVWLIYFPVILLFWHWIAPSLDRSSYLKKNIGAWLIGYSRQSFLIKPEIRKSGREQLSPGMCACSPVSAETDQVCTIVSTSDSSDLFLSCFTFFFHLTRFLSIFCNHFLLSYFFWSQIFPFGLKGSSSMSLLLFFLLMIGSSTFYLFCCLLLLLFLCRSYLVSYFVIYCFDPISSPVVQNLLFLQPSLSLLYPNQRFWSDFWQIVTSLREHRQVRQASHPQLRAEWTKRDLKVLTSFSKLHVFGVWRVERKKTMIMVTGILRLLEKVLMCLFMILKTPTDWN